MSDFRRRLLDGAVFSESRFAPNSSKAEETSFRTNVSMAQANLNKDERGLIISVPMQLKGDQFSCKGMLDKQELRFSLLLWDKLDWPDNFVISIEGGPDEEFLKQEGILVRSVASFSGGGSGAEIVRDAFLSTFRERDNSQPGHWSLARGERSISFDTSEMEQGRGILFNLHKAIPVPSKDVPFQDILEFRTKRRAELLSLRFHLEDIYQRVRSAPDSDLSQISELSKLDLALAEYLKVVHESRIPSVRASLSVNIDIKDLIVGSLVAERTLNYGLGEVAAGLSAMTATALSANASFTLGSGLKKRAPSSPFQYVSSIEDQLF